MADKDSVYAEETERRAPIFSFFKDAKLVFKFDNLGCEILSIALPSAMALIADPIASLVDTAFIGQIGPVELAAVGVAIALFNQISRIAIFPLVSVTTSFVAEEDTLSGTSPQVEKNERSEAGPIVDAEMKELVPLNKDLTATDCNIVKFEHKRRRIPSASSALLIGGILGIIQTMFLIVAAKPLLNFMGVTSVRDITNVALDPLLIYVFRLGVSGAAIAHVISQYLISLILLWSLIEKVDLIPPSIKHLQFHRFLKNGFLLFVRVIAVTFCVTLAASLAARKGPTSMAAFQVCLQIWLAVSLLADGLAVAGQAILAGAFANKDYEKVQATAYRVLQLGLLLGLALAFILGTGLHFGAKLFTKDVDVIHLIKIGIPFVAATQPLNALAFVIDGINFGASDFAYSAISLVGIFLSCHEIDYNALLLINNEGSILETASYYCMVVVAIFSIICLHFLSSVGGFIGIWIALTIYMALRAIVGLLRIGTGSGPWKMIRS
ncbi:Protein DETOXIFICATION 42 [Vigna angularis]|uniref:Protein DETOXIFICATION n=1 Tax=Phaseolus angularis TaxID=3914 RepID=A0A8T0KFQ8_PHAAN|nr:Protein DETOXIFICATION 42 [Vigna angularis]